MTEESFLYSIYAIAVALLLQHAPESFLTEPITASSKPPCSERVGGPSLTNGDLLFPGGSVAMSRVLHGGTQNLALDSLKSEGLGV